MGAAVTDIPPPRRADQALVERGLFPTRAKAQEAIAAGLVRADGRVVAKASQMLASESRLEAAAPHPWVSRGGVKLAAALDAFAFEPAGRVCLDVGASTGGFTDVLLARGAARVHAVDVGRDQLHRRLRADARVASREATDVRALAAEGLDPPPTLVVCDVSFIPLGHVLPALAVLAAPAAELVLLVKPQFEVGRDKLKKGIVKDDAARAQAVERVETRLREAGWTLRGRLPSPLEGGDGNREFLLGASR